MGRPLLGEQVLDDGAEVGRDLAEEAGAGGADFVDGVAFGARGRRRIRNRRQGGDGNVARRRGARGIGRPAACRRRTRRGRRGRLRRRDLRLRWFRLRLGGLGLGQRRDRGVAQHLVELGDEVARLGLDRRLQLEARRLQLLQLAAVGCGPRLDGAQSIDSGEKRVGVVVEGRDALVLQRLVGPLLIAGLGPLHLGLELAHLGLQARRVLGAQLAQRRAGVIDGLGEIVGRAIGGVPRRHAERREQEQCDHREQQPLHAWNPCLIRGRTPRLDAHVRIAEFGGQGCDPA